MLFKKKQSNQSRNTVCVVAILKGEEPFLDEWILYHRMLGVDHFFLYDDDEAAPLKDFLTPHSEYVTVIPWYGRADALPGRDRQTKAYCHALQHNASAYEWMAIIDGDEFIVLRKHTDLKQFLNDFPTAGAISLHWHVFGHNGYYDDPTGLITASLTRRMYLPNRNVKSITRTSSIDEITSAHFCHINQGARVDANNREYKEAMYPGKTDIAHINHYQCRSFTRWMDRVTRGVPCIDDVHNVEPEQKWRTDKELCLRAFVSTVALNKNEYVDEYMLRFKKPLEEAIRSLNRRKIPNE